MRTLALALFVYALSAPLMALEQPGTDAPHSPGWKSDYKEQLQDVYDAVLRTSKYGLKGQTKMAYFPQPAKGPDGAFLKNTDGSPKMGKIPPQFVGAGALAFAPNLGLNKGNNNPIVAVTEEIFTLCHDKDEIGFVLSHELAHLELDHPKKLVENIEKTMNDWWATKEPAINDWTSQMIQTEFQKDNKDKLAAFQKPLEDAADERGLILMKEAGFKETAAPKMMLHAQDMVWVMKWENGKDHATPKERAGKMTAKNREEMQKKLQMTLPADWKAKE